MAQAQETWKNVTLSTHGVTRLDSYGKRSSELVGPGKLVDLSTEERAYYQRSVAQEELDIFTNGCLIPVRLFDDDAKAEFASNPNLLSEDELTGMFKLQWKKFESEVAKISNIYALERMVRFADNSEDVTVKKYEVVKNRLEELREDAIMKSPSLKSLQDSAKRNARDAF